MIVSQPYYSNRYHILSNIISNEFNIILRFNKHKYEMRFLKLKNKMILFDYDCHTYIMLKTYK